MASERRILLAILATALMIRVALAFAVPPLQAPDERAHLRYVEHVVTERTLPVQPEPQLEELLRFWPQFYQPPLAYLLHAPGYALARATGADEAALVRVLRLQNALLGVLIVFVGWCVASRLTPAGDPRRAAIALALACWPGLAATASAVNNDALANLLAALLWLPLLRVPDDPRAAIAAGLVLGAALWTKFTVLPLVPLLFVVPWLARPRDPAPALRAALVAGGVAALVASPIFVRNLLVYGHPLAIGAGSLSFAWLAEVVAPERLAALREPMPGRVLRDLVGAFGVHANLTFAPAFWICGPLALLAAAGWWRGGARDPLAERAPALVAALLLAVCGLLWFSVGYYGGWRGRYLFSVALPMAALLAGGWLRCVPAALAGRALAGLAVVLLGLWGGLLLALLRFYADTPLFRWGFAASLQ